MDTWCVATCKTLIKWIFLEVSSSNKLSRTLILLQDVHFYANKMRTVSLMEIFP